MLISFPSLDYHTISKFQLTSEGGEAGKLKKIVGYETSPSFHLGALEEASSAGFCTGVTIY